MSKYYLIVILLLYGCLACNENNKQSIQFNGRQHKNINYCDSLIAAIETDSNPTIKFKKYRQFLEDFTFDTLSNAVLLFQLFSCDTSTQTTKFNSLQQIILRENILKQSSRGREILAKTYAKQIKLHKSAGNYDEVVNDCEHYLLYCNAITDTLYRSPVLNQLGTAYLRLGDPKKAIASLHLSLQYANDIHNAAMYAKSCSDLANAYGNIDKLDDAIKCIENGLKFPLISNDDRDWLMMMKVEYLNNDQDKINAFLDVLKITSSNDIRFICYKSLTNIFSQLKLYNEALSYAIKSTEIPNQEAREFAKQYLAIGHCYASMQCNDSALANYNYGLRKLVQVETIDGQVLPVYEKMKPENTVYDLLLAKADLIINQHKVDSITLNPAITCLESAAKVSELLRRQLVFDESKFDMGGDLKLVSEKLVQVYFLLSEKYATSDYARKAFMVVENSKAVTLQDNTEKDILQEELTDSNYTKFIELRKQLSDVENAMQLTQVVTQKDSLTNVSNHLIAQLGIYKSLSDAILTGNESNTTFELLNAYLTTHSYSALSYFMSEDNLYMFYVNPVANKIVFEQCDIQIIDSISTLCNLQMDETIYSTQKNRYLNLSNLVYETIVQKVTGNMNSGNQRLLVLPDGILHNLAFDALITNKIKPNSFLIKQFSISNAFSIRSLMTQEKEGSKFKSFSIDQCTFCNMYKSTTSFITK